jgi:hypothetical protein
MGGACSMHGRNEIMENFNGRGQCGKPRRTLEDNITIGRREIACEMDSFGSWQSPLTGF